jgi:hypothetical protein
MVQTKHNPVSDTNHIAPFLCHIVDAFSVEHTNALARAVVGSPLAEPPNTGRCNRLGGRSNRLGRGMSKT